MPDCWPITRVVVLCCCPFRRTLRSPLAPAARAQPLRLRRAEKLFASAFKKPTFTFKSVTLGDVSLTGVTLNLTYTLDNPNALGISLAQADYALFVEGHQVVAGKPPNGLASPRTARPTWSSPPT